VIIDATPGDQLVTPDDELANPGWKWFACFVQNLKRQKRQQKASQQKISRLEPQKNIDMIDRTNSLCDSSVLILYHTELHVIHTGMLRFHTNLCIHLCIVLILIHTGFVLNI
jgi:hypothetical protein